MARPSNPTPQTFRIDSEMASKAPVIATALNWPAGLLHVKNTFANFAFEHQEIAAYTSLIAMAETMGDTQSVASLKQSLAEEQAMADFIGSQIVPTTRRFIELTRQGAKAGV